MTERDDERTRRAEALLHHLSCAESIDEERAIAMRFGDDERRAGARAALLRIADEAVSFREEGAEPVWAVPEDLILMEARSARLASPPDGEPARTVSFPALPIDPTANAIADQIVEDAWRGKKSRPLTRDGEPAGGAESSYDDELTEWELHTAVRIAAHHGGLHDARVAVHQLVAMAHARGMVYGAALAEPPTPSAPSSGAQLDDSAYVEIVGPSGKVHYRRPRAEAEEMLAHKPKGYWIRDPSRAAPSAVEAECGTCDGAKYTRHLGYNNDEIVEDCPDCNGTGAPRASDGGGRAR